MFDVGETLVDETRIWSEWADWLGVPRLTFMAVIGAAIARGDRRHNPFSLFRPGVEPRDLARLRSRDAAIEPVGLGDLYADAIPTLEALAGAGYRLGVVGNQPSTIEALFRGLDVPLDLVASSETWSVEKPDPAFFLRIAHELRLPPADVAYVGDRIDNDVRPAAAVGMLAVFVRRGPWAWIQAGLEDPPEAALVVESLGVLPEALARLAPGR